MHAVGVSGSDETGAAAENEQVFIRTARDPYGNVFSLQATRAFGMAGPIFIGPESDPFKGGRALRVVNRLLARVQQPRPIQSVIVTAIRMSGDEEEVVFTDEATSMTDGRRKVLSMAEEIEAGTFEK